MTGEQMAACHLSATPNPLERPIKMGWLKKQRSIVRNWQQRYFVLRAQQLYYYKDEEDMKPQVQTYCLCFPLPPLLAAVCIPTWRRWQGALHDSTKLHRDLLNRIRQVHLSGGCFCFHTSF